MEDALSCFHEAAAQQQSLRARQRELESRRADLLDIQSGLAALENRKKLQQKYDAKAALIDASNRLAGAQARTAKLPPRETLDDLLPEARSRAGTLGATLGFALMMLLDVALG